MKKLTTFFMALFLIAMAGAVLFVTAAVYDVGGKLTVEPYFFQPDDLSSRRIGVPASPADLGQDTMRDMLIRRYITEYFYVVPSMANIDQRTGPNGTLRQMSTAAVYDGWVENTLPQIQEMAQAGKMRLVRFSTDAHDSGFTKLPGSDYWEIRYELHTWDAPNDLSATPTVTPGVMQLKFVLRDGIRESVQQDGVHEYLDAGNDPALLFQFGVTEIAVQ